MWDSNIEFTDDELETYIDLAVSWLPIYTAISVYDEQEAGTSVTTTNLIHRIITARLLMYMIKQNVTISPYSRVRLYDVDVSFNNNDAFWNAFLSDCARLGIGVNTEPDWKAYLEDSYDHDDFEQEYDVPTRLDV
jgi:hypothetical protein